MKKCIRSLPIAHFAKMKQNIAHHFIMLFHHFMQLNPVSFFVYREEWWFDHSALWF